MPSHLLVSNCNNSDEIQNIIQEQERFYLLRKHEYDKIQKLTNILPEVYFARIDLVNENDEIETYYVSKNGLELINTIDWRSSLGSLIYNNTTSKFENQQIVLKRKFNLSHDKLLSVRDVYKDNVGNNTITDSFLINKNNFINLRKNEYFIRLNKWKIF